MAQDFRSLFEKADMALGELTSNGGVLQPAQAAKFVAKILRRAVVLPMARTVTMNAPKQLVEKIGFTTRVMRAGTARTALSVNDRSKPVTEKVELDSKYLKAEVRLDTAILEDSIERGNLRTTIMNRLLDAVPRDLDELAVNGDTTSSDTYLAVMDGYVKLATSHTYDANDAELSGDVLRLLLRQIPVQYRRSLEDMAFLTGWNAEVEYRNTFGQRVGMDAYLLENKRIQYSGIPLVPVDVHLETLGTNSDQTTVLLSPRQNMLIGFWRQVSIKTDEDISSDEIIVVVTLRMAVQYEEEDAVAKATEVRVPLAA